MKHWLQIILILQESKIEEKNVSMKESHQNEKLILDINKKLICVALHVPTQGLILFVVQ